MCVFTIIVQNFECKLLLLNCNFIRYEFPIFNLYVRKSNIKLV